VANVHRLLKLLFGLFGLVIGLLGAILWFAFIGFLIYLIVARIWLELVIVAFKINESAQQISAHTATTAGSPPPPPPAITPGETGTPPATTG